MNQAWPRWATLRAEEVREKLPPEEWGPWAANRSCTQSDALDGTAAPGLHPAEEPYFFHCRAHLTAIRRSRRTRQPHPYRDHGLCAKCGQPAEPTRTTMVPTVACVEAERRNTTVARLSTKQYCASCTPQAAPLCPGRTCSSGKAPKRVLPAGCCAMTASGKSRHCARCCEAAKSNRRTNPQPGPSTSPASKENRQKRIHRRRQAVALRRQGMDVQQIARSLGITARTIKEYLDEADDMARRAREVRYQNDALRRQRIAELHQQAKTPEEIAPLVGLTVRTIQRNIAALSKQAEQQSKP